MPTANRVNHPEQTRQSGKVLSLYDLQTSPYGTKPVDFYVQHIVTPNRNPTTVKVWAKHGLFRKWVSISLPPKVF
jgi:hypothetical protein